MLLDFLKTYYNSFAHENMLWFILTFKKCFRRFKKIFKKCQKCKFLTEKHKLILKANELIFLKILMKTFKLISMAYIIIFSLIIKSNIIK